MTEATEQTLAALFQELRREGLRSAAGRDAAERIVRLFGAQVLALSRRSARPHDVEDVFQDAFVQLFQQALRGSLPRSPGAYLATVVRRTAARLRRDDGAEHELRDEEPRDDQGSAYTERDLIARIDVSAALPALSAQEREVILAALDAVPPEVVAERLGLSAENVRQVRSRAIRKLRELVDSIDDLAALAALEPSDVTF